MTEVTAYRSFDMDVFRVFRGDTTSSSDTEIELRLGARTAVYTGSFDYGPGDTVGGTVSSVVFGLYGYLETVSFTGIDADAGRVFDALAAGDTDGFFRLLLGRSDTITGSAGVDVIDAGGGNDTVYGGTGDDSLSGGTGRDQIFGEDDDDSLFGGGDRDTLNGGNGDDTLNGGQDRDRLIGGAGDDDLTGASGNDTLLGQSGQDTLSGGGGNDWMIGGGGSDAMAGGGGNDRLDGGTGADVLAGQGGSDRLLGRQGDDRIDGGGSRDWIDGGAGDDRLTGGGGNDRFIFFADEGGRDVITDFDADGDSIRIALGAASRDDVRIETASDRTTIHVDGTGASIILLGVSLQEGEFRFDLS